jgi:hypothetical protein
VALEQAGRTGLTVAWRDPSVRGSRHRSGLHTNRTGLLRTAPDCSGLADDGAFSTRQLPDPVETANHSPRQYRLGPMPLRNIGEELAQDLAPRWQPIGLLNPTVSFEIWNPCISGAIVEWATGFGGQPCADGSRPRRRPRSSTEAMPPSGSRRRLPRLVIPRCARPSRNLAHAHSLTSSQVPRPLPVQSTERTSGFGRSDLGIPKGTGF